MLIKPELKCCLHVCRAVATALYRHTYTKSNPLFFVYFLTVWYFLFPLGWTVLWSCGRILEISYDNLMTVLGILYDVCR